MSSRTPHTITLTNLSRTQATAIRRGAERLGVTPESYAKSLLVDALEMEKIAATKTFEELSVPFQKALGHLSEEELDALSRPSKWKGKR